MGRVRRRAESEQNQISGFSDTFSAQENRTILKNKKQKENASQKIQLIDIDA
jgi:hypothetical protein